MNKKKESFLKNKTGLSILNIIDIISRSCLCFSVYWTIVSIQVLLLPNAKLSAFSQYSMGLIYLIASVRLATLNINYEAYQ